MRYKYITENNLENRQDYMYSKFEGKDFIYSYFNTRKNFISNFSNKDNINSTKYKIYVDYSKRILSDFKVIQSNYMEDKEIFFGKLSDKDFFIEEKLTSIIDKIIANDINFEVYFYLSGLIKNFEVSKRVYEEYSYNFKAKNRENYKNIELYALLSLASIIFYTKSKNFKFLNSSLKLNDSLISISNYIKPIYLDIFLCCIELEMMSIYCLCLERGIKL